MGSKPVEFSTLVVLLQAMAKGNQGVKDLRRQILEKSLQKTYGLLPTAQGKTFLCSYLTWRGSCGLIQQVFPPEFGLVPDGSRKPKLAGRAPYLPDRFHRILQT